MLPKPKSLWIEQYTYLLFFLANVEGRTYPVYRIFYIPIKSGKLKPCNDSKTFQAYLRHGHKTRINSCDSSYDL